MIVIATASLPIIESRGAIPLVIALGLTPLHSLVLSMIGSMIPVPLLLFGLRPILKGLKEVKPFARFMDHIIYRTLKKSKNVNKYGFWGLILLVAIPLPGTGVWSGSLAAVLLNIRFKLALLAILCGNMLAVLIILITREGTVRTINIFH